MSKPIVVGVDVSKNRLDITLINGKQRKSYDIPYTQQAFNQLVEGYGHDKLHVVCEATGNYHLRLGKFARERGLRFSAINPFVIKRYSDIWMKRAKTDRVDSGLIAQYGYEYAPQNAPEIPLTRMYMQQLLKAIEALHNSERAYRNRLEAHSVHPYGLEEVRAAYDHILGTLVARRKVLEQQLIQMVKTEYESSYGLLLSIPGIGPIGASVIIAFFGCFEAFETSKQVISFMGTSPKIRQSGQSKGTTTTSRQGSPYLRKKLYMCAISARRYNPHCVPLYRRLLEKGLSPKAATVAVLNKLVRQAFGVLKSNKPFNPEM